MFADHWDNFEDGTDSNTNSCNVSGYSGAYSPSSTHQEKSRFQTSIPKPLSLSQKKDAKRNCKFDCNPFDRVDFQDDWFLSDNDDAVHQSMDSDEWFDSDIAYFTHDQHNTGINTEAQTPSTGNYSKTSRRNLMSKLNKESNQQQNISEPTRGSSASRMRVLSQRLQQEQLQRAIQPTRVASESVPQRPPTSSGHKRIIDKVFDEFSPNDRHSLSETSMTTTQSQKQTISRTGTSYQDSFVSGSSTHSPSLPLAKRSRLDIGSIEPLQQLAVTSDSFTTEKRSQTPAFSKQLSSHHTHTEMCTGSHELFRGDQTGSTFNVPTATKHSTSKATLSNMKSYTQNQTQSTSFFTAGPVR